MVASPSDFFVENQQRFSSVQGTSEEMEKYNLYGGLRALAEEVETISRMLKDIQGRIYTIESRANR